MGFGWRVWTCQRHWNSLPIKNKVDICCYVCPFFTAYLIWETSAHHIQRSCRCFFNIIMSFDWNAIHPSIFCPLSRVGSWGEQPKQTHIPLSWGIFPETPSYLNFSDWGRISSPGVLILIPAGSHLVGWNDIGQIKYIKKGTVWRVWPKWTFSP